MAVMFSRPTSSKGKHCAE